jgi:glycosyltransferase involved in cell wall biosynthesis
MQAIVSIIIPTFNRGHLISETLNSVLMQTYQNWECIIVDDGSTDNTEEVVKKFVEKDKRFQFYKRPIQKNKGPNSCRNYGFNLSKGEYINWFDDDDLMVENRIEVQLKSIVENNLDFNVCKHKDFNDDIKIIYPDKHLRNLNKALNIENFIDNKIFFATTDFFCTKKSIEKLKFDEFVQTGQEYQIFCQYLIGDKKGMFINEVLSLRRIHENSVQILQKNSAVLINKNKFKSYFRTYLNIKNDIKRNERIILVRRAAIYYLSLTRDIEFEMYKKDLFLNIKELYGVHVWVQYAIAVYYLKFSQKAKFRIKKYFKNLL